FRFRDIDVFEGAGDGLRRAGFEDLEADGDRERPEVTRPAAPAVAAPVAVAVDRRLNPERVDDRAHQSGCSGTKRDGQRLIRPEFLRRFDRIRHHGSLIAARHRARWDGGPDGGPAPGVATVREPCNSRRERFRRSSTAGCWPAPRDASVRQRTGPGTRAPTSDQGGSCPRPYPESSR